MPSSSSSGSSTRRRSISSASWGEPVECRLEDRPGTVENRARMAGGIHREPAARAQWAPGGQYVLGLLRERGDLLMAEPEANARGVFGRRAVLARGGLAGHQDEHLAGFVVSESHLADLPFGLPGREPGLAGSPFKRLDPLGFQHLVE